MTKADNDKILELFYKVYGNNYELENFINDMVSAGVLIPIDDFDYALTARGMDLYPYLAETSE